MKTRKILIPIDFSEASRRAMRYGLEFARDLGAEATLLHAYALPNAVLPDGSVILADAQLLASVVDEVDRLMRSALEEAALFDAPVSSQTVQGDAAKEIVRVADEGGYDLIVMGTHGRTGMGRLLAGSIAEEVMRRAPCAVLTVKAPRPAPSLTVPRRRPAEVNAAAEPITVSRAAAFLSMFGAPGTSIARAFSKPWR